MKIIKSHLLTLVVLFFLNAPTCTALGLPVIDMEGVSIESYSVIYAQEGMGADDAESDMEEGDLDYLEEEKPDRIADPLEPLNRWVFYFNDKMYFWVMKPVAKGYSAIVPEGIRISVKNFFNNITTPVRLVNNLLQLKIKPAGNELLRFGVNSTVGMLGLYDVARSEMGISMSDEDFGQTLGVWGVDPLIFINWPFIGPSTVRDSIGYGGDYFLNPVNYIKPVIDSTAVSAGEAINRTSLSIGEYEAIKKDALDPYSAIKDIYYQYRKSKIAR